MKDLGKYTICDVYGIAWEVPVGWIQPVQGKHCIAVVLHFPFNSSHGLVSMLKRRF